MILLILFQTVPLTHIDTYFCFFNIISFRVLKNQVKLLRLSRSDLSIKVDMLSHKCNELDSLNRILSTENHVCLSMLSAARATQQGQRVAGEGLTMRSVESPRRPQGLPPAVDSPDTRTF